MVLRTFLNVTFIPTLPVLSFTIEVVNSENSVVQVSVHYTPSRAYVYKPVGYCTLNGKILRTKLAQNAFSLKKSIS